MKNQSLDFCKVIVLVGVCAILIPGLAAAYPYYTQGSNNYCSGCHGGFRSSNYTSLVDGQNWGNLHNLHRSTMLSGDCETCHGNNDYPVSLDSSAGGSGLAAISCMGCHGRAEDNVPANPSYPFGYGAGLRQHHTSAGVSACLNCHDDADPANYTPVGEDVLPTYYANPGSGHSNMPTSACNEDGSENFAGATIGLDNNGNNVYDGDDAACNGASPAPDQPAALAGLLQNHPNPFNPSTTIKYVLPDAGYARVQIYSVTGELVRTLVNASNQAAGTYQVEWNGTDDNGRPVSSGVFFYRLESAGGSEMQKMTLVK